jgi:SulP family sulfate permease
MPVSGGSVRLHLSAVKPQVRAILDADGLLDLLGVDRVHADVRAAVEAELA